MRFRISVLAAALAACVFAFAAPGWAGTTGGLHGRVVDAGTGAPIAAAKVAVTSPSQNESTTTDANGYWDFISLSPDTYTITVSKAGYDLGSIPGVTVVSDQSHAVPITLQKTLKTLATVTTRGSASLVRPGMTSDVYSINSSTQKATAALAGSGSLNQAYGAIASAPGVVYQQGQQGWYQSIYIRGGDIDQTAYEVDGVPVMRVSDSATVGTLSNLGQQEVQVYTGGTPASADASGIAGYVNQVIKTGTYPGYQDLKVAFGAPALYNSGTFEASGASPNRQFSYYIGESVTGQGYRYGDQFNGVSNPLFFFPMFIPSNNGSVFDGSGTPIFAPGATYGISQTLEAETVANFHYQLPHKNDALRDDIQLLYTYSNLNQKFYSSISDLGVGTPAALAILNGGSPFAYLDQFAYNGPVFQAPDPSQISTQLFPNEGKYRPAGQQIPINEREGSQNGAALIKLQFQKNIDAKTYLRFFGYSQDSWWLISGPVSANLTFGDQLPDYEVIGHTFGGDAIFSKQLNEHHLINATLSYFTSKLQTYSMGFQSGTFTSLIDTTGNCYNPATGNNASCFDTSIQGTAANLSPGTPPPGSPGALANAQWIVTENGQNGQIDNVKPEFSAVSVTDSWRPTDRLTMNLGIRVENFRYILQDLASGYPARQFWFNAYNREFCFGPGFINPVQRTFDPITGAESACPTGSTPTQLSNYGGGTISNTVPQPRFGMTYSLNSDNVLRASYGRYARPAPTSYQEFNTVQQNLPTFLGTFVSDGWNTPVHNIYSDTSDNYDFSWEHHFPGTTMAMKITPFLRTTQGQLQFSSLNAQGVVAGVNAGKQVSDGLEFAISKGSFDRDGFSWQESMTFTHSRIKYGPYPNGLNVIDLLNKNIQQYNSYTSACATAAPSGDPTSLCGINGNAFAVAVCQPSNNCNPNLPVTNPYFNSAPQPLFDRNGWYTTYDQIPSPFSNAIGFETPFQATLVLNWKSGPFTITPNVVYSTQGKYGSPLQWPGYDPASCTATVSGTIADTTTCSGFIFIPDKFTGVFDNLGAFQQPNRLTAGISFTYKSNPRFTTTLTIANLIDHCYQRGQPWDAGSTCQYAQLDSNLLAPAGNFVANPPIQLAFPYGSWYNNLEIAQLGQRNPVQAVLEFEFRP